MLAMLESSPKSQAEKRLDLVSVIMPCFTMGRFIARRWRLWGAQTYPHWEVIAVDDCGPEDGTRAAVEDFARRFPEHRVEYIRHEQNRGVSAARNTAIRAARGEFLAFLDPDDWWPPDYLARQAAALGRAPDLALVFAPAVQVTETGRELGVVSGKEFHGHDEVVQHLYLGNAILPSAVLLRRAPFLQLGLFDETPELQHLEDWDAWLRLAQAGFRLGPSPDTCCYWRRHDGSASVDMGTVYERTVVLRRKHCARPDFLEATLRYLLTLEKEAFARRSSPLTLAQLVRMTLGRIRQDAIRWIRRRPRQARR